MSKGFENHLTSLNKKFASSITATLRVYFTPIHVSRLVVVVHYYNHAVNSLHLHPRYSPYRYTNKASKYTAHYEDSICDSDNEMDVKVPQLNGWTNWIDFRDKFTMKISNMSGFWNVILNYIIDVTTRDITGKQYRDG